MNMSKFVSLGLILLSLLTINHNVLAVDDAKEKDDSDIIVGRLKDSMSGYGLISVEQGTGRLLFNPTIQKLNVMPLKQRFIVPAMIVNQRIGLKIVEETTFSCFLIDGSDLTGDGYKGFKQYETARYLREIKRLPAKKVLLCQAMGVTATKNWVQKLDLNIAERPFVFDEHTSISGEHFFYFLNADGMFEMYIYSVT